MLSRKDIIDDFNKRFLPEDQIYLEFVDRFDAMLKLNELIKENNDRNMILQDCYYNEIEILETINTVVIFQANEPKTETFHSEHSRSLRSVPR